MLGLPSGLVLQAGRSGCQPSAIASIARSLHLGWMDNNSNSKPDSNGQPIEAQAARAGLKTGHIRWVLGIGIVLTVLGFAIVWLIARP
jgi:hypothetical protein